ncbi:kinase-like domain-containing protein [Suillus subaureus]|uniref:Kinase-like domain-containing protein n=1 Tax=Suillus subaureus TaxID=48587 RepID=A0A9P7JBE9_9AGAM|nr:kinase-like domain-containing protein [Suillus subaureus]KAG1812605.1 kinase-like domain-containing protein [Suillus subaureus]
METTVGPCQGLARRQCRRNLLISLFIIALQVAVKTFRHQMDCTSEQGLRRFRRETAIWAHLIHDNIVTLYGTTEDFGPTTALVSQWFPDGTLFRLITEQGATLTIESKLKLLHGIASGLYYLHSHSFTVVHGDITSSNVLVDLKDGDYKACLTDFGLSNVLCGCLNDHPVEGSSIRPGAIRWAAPELLRPHDPLSDIKPTTQNDMYSFGRVMYHLLTLVIPWHGIDEIKVFQKILSGEEILRPAISDATSDVTDARWNHIEQCWSIDPPGRPCAFTAMNFVKGELEALKQDNVFDGGVQEYHQSSSDAERIIASIPPSRGAPSQIMTTVMFQSSSQTLVLSPSQATPSSPFTHHLFSTASTLSFSGPLNVLLFGETGVGKSSVINLIMGGDVAQTSPDGATCTLTHTCHKIDLGPHTFKLWEVSSIESMGFFKTFFKKWSLKKQYKRLYKDDGVYLLLYCMRGSRAQKALLRDYKFSLTSWALPPGQAAYQSPLCLPPWKIIPGTWIIGGRIIRTIWNASECGSPHTLVSLLSLTIQNPHP